MQDSSCSGKTQKTNLQQFFFFFLQSSKFQDSNFNLTGLHQEDLFERFKENNLAKVSFLKLLTFFSFQLTENGRLH